MRNYLRAVFAALILLFALAAPAALAAPSGAHYPAATGAAYYLETPHGLCVWVKALKSGSQLIEVPCRGTYAWGEQTTHGQRQLTPAGAHGRLSMANVGGHLLLTTSSNWRATATFGYGTFPYHGRTWTIIEFAHAPRFLGEHGRGKVVTLIGRPSKPWSGLYFQPVGGVVL